MVRHDLSAILPCFAALAPRLDALAGEGLRFLDAHSPSAVCSPTRYGILTGRCAWRTELTRDFLASQSEGRLGPLALAPGEDRA